MAFDVPRLPQPSGTGVHVEADGRLLVSGERVKAILGVSQGTLQNRTAKGDYPKPRRGLYDVAGCVAGELRLARRLDTPGDLKHERALLAREQRAAVAIRNAVAQSKLVAVEDVVLVVGTDYREVKEAVLATLSRLARYLAPDALALVDREVRETLEGLSAPDRPEDVPGWLASRTEHEAEEASPPPTRTARPNGRGRPFRP